MVKGGANPLFTNQTWVCYLVRMCGVKTYDVYVLFELSNVQKVNNL